MAVGSDVVPVDLLRDHFLSEVQRGRLSATEVAERLGWMRRYQDDRPRGDGSRVLRALGLKAVEAGSQRTQSVITYHRAVELCLAMGGDPVDFDL